MNAHNFYNGTSGKIMQKEYGGYGDYGKEDFFRPPAEPSSDTPKQAR